MASSVHLLYFVVMFMFAIITNSTINYIQKYASNLTQPNFTGKKFAEYFPPYSPL